MINCWKLFHDVWKRPRTKNIEKNRQRRKRTPGGGRKGLWGIPENKLFFILHDLKNYPTFEVVGFSFGISPSQAHEQVKQLIPMLKSAQKTLRVLPKQRFENAAEFSQVVENNRNIVIDATERAAIPALMHWRQ